MNALAFDTLKFAQTLRDKAKFTQEQSEGIASAIAEATTDQLATKADIRELKSELKEYNAIYIEHDYDIDAHIDFASREDYAIFLLRWA